MPKRDDDDDDESDEPPEIDHPDCGGWLGAEFIAPADGGRVNGFFSDYVRFREELTGTPT